MGQRYQTHREVWRWLASGRVRTAGRKRRTDHAPHSPHKWPRRYHGWSSALQEAERTEGLGPASRQSQQETLAQIGPVDAEQSSPEKSDLGWGSAGWPLRRYSRA